MEISKEMDRSRMEELRESEVNLLATRVFVRVRPLVDSEVTRNDALITWKGEDDNTSVVIDLVDRGVSQYSVVVYLPPL